MSAPLDLREAVDTLRDFDFGYERTLEQAVLMLVNAYDELNAALDWHTTCLNCASLLDENYGQYVKLDKIRAVLEGEL